MNEEDKNAASQRLILHNSADLEIKAEGRKRHNSSLRGEPEQHHQLLEIDNLGLDQEQDSESEDEAQKERVKKINDILNKKNLKEAAAMKMVVGTGFTMDVTQFFQFKRKQLRAGEDVGIFQEITGSRIAWIILLYSVTTGAMIPGWIMNIGANKYLRISFRFMLQMLTVVPFVLYEYRNGSQTVRQKYSLSYIFKTENFIKPLISSLSASMWFTCILGSFDWTSVSHAIVLGSLSNFFLSLGRSYNKVNHQLQLGGQVLVCGGLALVLYDSITFGPNNESPHYYDFKNYLFLQRTWWERVTFDLIAFCVSFFVAQFSKFTSDMGRYYPPFLSMFLVQNLNCILMAFSAFFVNGCEWSYDSFWGFFSIFSSKHFAGFMFMGIMLSLGQIVSLTLVTRMFPDPIIPALAMTLDPFIASLIVNITGIQALPGTISLVGYIFVIPGLSLILVGQCLYNRISAKSKEHEDRSIDLMKELQYLRQRREQRKKKHLERELHKKLNVSRAMSG